MKETKKFLLMLLVVAVPMGMIACSDDDDPVTVIPNEAAAGTYDGEYAIGTLAKGDITVKIAKTANTEDVVSIALGDIDITSVVPEGRAENPGQGQGEGEGEGEGEKILVKFGTISGVKLNGAANNLTITEQELETTISIASENIKDVPAKLKLKGAIVSQASLSLSVTSFDVENEDLQAILDLIPNTGISISAKKKNN